MMRSASLILSSSVRSVTSRRLPLAAGIGVSADPATSSSAPVRSTRPFSSAAQPCPEDCGTPCPEDCVGSDGNFLAGGSEQTDFFKILGVERQFAIDEKALKSTYRHLMAQYHPDRHHSLKTPDELESLTDMSSSITRAYGVLTDPHSRAEHLLELMGGPITENCGNLVADGSLLMDVMEIREEIDDAEEDAEVLRTLMEQNAKRMGDTCMELADAFEKNDLEEARKLTSRLQYWKRIEEKIVDKLSTVR